MIIKPADKWFSLCVRERSDWVCEYCGKKYNQPTSGLHCSHYYGRRNKAVRFEPFNAFAHCFFCHNEFGGNPHKFHAWALEKLGQENYDILVELSNQIEHGRTVNRGIKSGEIAKFYRTEYQKMRVLRDAGQTGRIEFESWYNVFSGSPTR